MAHLVWHCPNFESSWTISTSAIILTIFLINMSDIKPGSCILLSGFMFSEWMSGIKPSYLYLGYQKFIYNQPEKWKQQNHEMGLCQTYFIGWNRKLFLKAVAYHPWRSKVLKIQTTFLTKTPLKRGGKPTLQQTYLSFLDMVSCRSNQHLKHNNPRDFRKGENKPNCKHCQFNFTKCQAVTKHWLKLVESGNIAILVLEVRIISYCCPTVFKHSAFTESTLYFFNIHSPSFTPLWIRLCTLVGSASSRNAVKFSRRCDR